MKNQEAFDLEKVLDEQIYPLVQKIIEICKEHKMPMFASFLYANDPDGDADLCTTNLCPENWNRPIPDEFLRLIDVIRPPKVPPLRLRVKNGDVLIEETIIIP